MIYRGRFKVLTKTGTDWNANDLVLQYGEVGAADAGSSAPILKLGDGVRPFSALPPLMAQAQPANDYIAGDTTTLPPGSNATVTIDNTVDPPTISIGVPEGRVGPAGPPNQLTVGTVVTGAPGSPAVVTITGEAPQQVINFSIPRGEDGTGTGGGGGDVNTDTMNVFSATNRFTKSGGGYGEATIELEAEQAFVRFRDPTQGADQRDWLMGPRFSMFSITAPTDTATDLDYMSGLFLDRNYPGAGVSQVRVQPMLAINNYGSPKLALIDFNMAENADRWEVLTQDGQFVLRTVSSDMATTNDALSVARLGTTITQIALHGGALAFTGSAFTFNGQPVVTGTGGSGGVTDHGALTGLEDDDHPQYLTPARADLLYAPIVTTGAGLGTANTFTATNAFTKSRTGANDYAVTVSSAAPYILINETDAAVDNRKWQIYADTARLFIGACNDAESSSSYGLQFGRTNGYQVAGIAMTSASTMMLTAGGALTLQGGTGVTTPNTFTFTKARSSLTSSGEAALLLNSAWPVIEFIESDAATDKKRWMLYANNGEFHLASGSDSEGVWNDVLKVTRTGATLNQTYIYGANVALFGLTSNEIKNSLLQVDYYGRFTGWSSAQGTAGGPAMEVGYTNGAATLRAYHLTTPATLVPMVLNSGTTFSFQSNAVEKMSLSATGNLVVVGTVTADDYVTVLASDRVRETGRLTGAAALLSRLRHVLYRRSVLDEDGNTVEAGEELGLIPSEVAAICPQLAENGGIRYDRLALLLLADWQERYAAA